jgi:streptogramin lyase
LTLGGSLGIPLQADPLVRGRVLDTNGRAVAQAQVTLQQRAGSPGATAITVFTDGAGGFAFPDPVAGDAELSVRALGFRQLHEAAAGNERAIVMQHTANQAGVAPASAWLGKITDPAERTDMVMFCVGCHQIPPPEVRAYADAVDAVTGADPAVVRDESWRAMVEYMNFLTAEEIGRGVARVGALGPREAYGYGLGKRDATPLLTKYLTGGFDRLEGYDYGAPLAVTPDTVIREYEIAHPNAVREAVLLGTPPRLWVAEMDSNRIISIDVASGAQRELTVPTDLYIGPHTLVLGSDDSLWIAPQYNSVVARFDPAREEWRTWRPLTETGGNIGIHDLAFDWRNQLAPDARGRIWFSDVVNNAVGYLDPDSGESKIFRAPEVPGRTERARLYGIVMTSDRKHVWYSQLGIGIFGCFNTETLEFETVVQLPDANAGPRRIAIDENDVLYVALFGAGQLIEYDTGARKQIAIHDLPDRASAPYAVTWDAGRRVVWVATSNADAIYRFDPATRAFGVLPLPRERAFLRMLAVDPETGLLATSYANIPKRVHGPRMALLIDPGDGYRPVSRTALSARSTDD